MEVPQVQTRRAATFPDAAGLCLFPRQGESCQDLTTPPETWGLGKWARPACRIKNYSSDFSRE